MAKKKIIEVPDELIPVSKASINVEATTKEVAIPKGTVAWKSGDNVGFINKSGVETLRAWHKAQGLPFEADETLTTIPRPIMYRTPFGKNTGGCKNC